MCWAEADLEDIFAYYEAARLGLGAEFMTEFRRAVDLMLQHPRAWQALDPVYRRCRLHRFPYGVVYRIVDAAQQIVIQSATHLGRNPTRRRR